ncbi:MAG: hypothetical protein COT89_00400 [Candidatus Colwellbacteria bacterium CG10_big_fil_rev_8_21_14_0_10_42_22]|uniref:Uncharacterized protein n=1 Tax=Candidatus Colwellbacteria bacterium CG10_big_fil_rev_8_21_14_0_10_42_22 TaxID=1974540 RepID=A0A2H0VGG3_9BACT|nr:MAG: hypothetical protein COT89_00400 [Candidatus Colwellbacteria bacterium CG10_big_fil_rev_8_21_14_0_10_42_22]
MSKVERPIVPEEWDSENPKDLAKKIEDDKVGFKEDSQAAYSANVEGFPSAEAYKLLAGILFGKDASNDLFRLREEKLGMGMTPPETEKDKARVREITKNYLRELREKIDQVLEEY